jgi:hypothetical protein
LLVLLHEVLLLLLHDATHNFFGGFVAITHDKPQSRIVLVHLLQIGKETKLAAHLDPRGASWVLHNELLLRRGS